MILGMAISPSIDTAYLVTLYGGPPWGFRLEGGLESKEPIYISKVNPNSKSFREGVQVGQKVCRINGEVTFGISLEDAQRLVKQAGNTLELELKRENDVGAVADEKRKSPTKSSIRPPAEEKRKGATKFSPPSPVENRANSPLTESPVVTSSASDMPLSSTRIQLRSSAPDHYTSHDEEVLSDTVIRRKPKLNVISYRGQMTSLTRNGPSLDSTFSCDSSAFSTPRASPPRINPTRATAGTPIKIGRNIPTPPPYCPSPVVSSHSETKIGRKGPIKLSTPTARSPSPGGNYGNKSTWRQQTCTQGLDDIIDAFIHDCNRDSPIKISTPSSPIKTSVSFRYPFSPTKISTPNRSPSPNRHMSVRRQQSSSQALDDQVAAITRELEALAQNMDRLIFSPPPVRSYSPDLDSPPRILSPTSGTTSKSYRPVVFSVNRTGSSPSSGQPVPTNRSGSSKSDQFSSLGSRSEPSHQSGRSYQSSGRSDSPLSVASSGMTINVDNIMARDAVTIPPSQQRRLVEEKRTDTEARNRDGYDPSSFAPRSQQQSTGYQAQQQKVEGGSRGHAMFLRQKQKLRESEDEFTQQSQQLQQQGNQEESTTNYQYQQQQQQPQHTGPTRAAQDSAVKSVQHPNQCPSGRTSPPVYVQQSSLQLRRSLTPTADTPVNHQHLPSVRQSIQVINKSSSSPIKPVPARGSDHSGGVPYNSGVSPFSPTSSRSVCPFSPTPSSGAAQCFSPTPSFGSGHPFSPTPSSEPRYLFSPTPTSEPAYPFSPTSSGPSQPWGRSADQKQKVVVNVRSVSPSPMSRRNAPGPSAIQVESSVTSPSHGGHETNNDKQQPLVNGLVNGGSHDNNNSTGSWNQEIGDILSDIEETTKRVRQNANDVGVWCPGSGKYTVKQKQFRSVKLDPHNGEVIVKSEVSSNKSSVHHKNDVNAKQMNGHTDTTPTYQPISDQKLNLPKTQSPSITLLQKYREGQIPKGAIHLGTQESLEGDVKHQDTFYLLPTEKHITTQVTEKKAPKYEGIGPKDSKTGVPVGLKSTIDEKNQKDWYKEFYKTLHVSDKPKDEIDVLLLENDTDINTYRPTYTFPEPEPEPPKTEVSESPRDHDVVDGEDEGTLTRTRAKSTSLAQSKSLNWAPAHAKSKLEKYRNQPNRIEDYEPGKSSLALQEKRTFQRIEKIQHSPKSSLYNPPIEKPGQNSQYTLSERPHLVSKPGPHSPPFLIDPDQQHQWYKQVQRGGEIPYTGFRKPEPDKKDEVDDVFVTDYRPKSAAERLGVKTPPPFNIKGVKALRHHHSTSELPTTRPSPSSTLERGTPADRKSRDEEDARRKHYLNILNEENKRKRAEEERKSQELRRHNDNFLPKQKSPIPEDRFDGVQPPRLDKKHKPLEIKGKARALYSFKAQNIKELSFRKNDLIYLLKKIDDNWYEAERHGMRGIVPLNYVEVVKSIEEAQSLAQRAEGFASVRYKFRKQNPIELNADKGEIVQLLRRVDENWYEARIHGHQGIIPASYLDVNREPDTPFITPAPSVVASAIHSTVTTPGPGTPVRPLSPLVPDPLSPPEWDFTKFYLPGMPVNRAESRDNTLRKHATLPRDYVSPVAAQREFAAPPSSRNRYYSESSIPPDTRSYGADHHMDDMRPDLGGDRYDSRYSTLDSRKSADDHWSQPVQPRRRDVYADGHRAQPQLGHDEPLKAYRVLFNYLPQNDDELDIREGDHVYVLEKCDDGWFVGTSTRTGQFGTFPGNYVRPV